MGEIVIGGVVVLGVFSLFSGLDLRKHPKGAQKVLGQAMICMAIVSTLFVVMAPIFLEFSDERSVVVSFNEQGSVVGVSRWFVLCWSKCSNVKLWLPDIRSVVQPITDNPKVRRLKYAVAVDVFDPVMLFRSGLLKPELQADFDTEHNVELMSRAVQYELYEFNNATSKDLARFYNPLDRTQSVELENLLMNYLNPRLEPSGLRMRGLRGFEIE